MIHLAPPTWSYGPVDQGLHRLHHSIDISVRGSNASAIYFLDLNGVVDYADTERFSYEKFE